MAKDCAPHFPRAAAGLSRTGTVGLRRWMPPTLGALLLTGTCVAAPPRGTSEPPLPTGAELIQTRREWLRPSCQACMDAAADAQAQEACVNAEFAWHDDKLNRAYQQRHATLSQRDQGVLRKLQRRWVRQIYEGPYSCKVRQEHVPAPRVDERQCLIAATISRWRELEDARYVARRIENWLNPRKDGGEDLRTPAESDFGLPDADGNLQLRLGDIGIEARVADCKGLTKKYCRLESLTLKAPWGSQALHPPQLFFLDAADPLRGFQVTAYRGLLSEGFVNMLPTFIVYDLNSDGHEDLMLWTDPYGSYGDPSYTYYLFDPERKQLVEAPELAAATRGFSLSRIRLNELDLWYRDGPCLRGEKTIAIRGTAPIEIFHNDYNTCE